MCGHKQQDTVIELTLTNRPGAEQDAEIEPTVVGNVVCDSVTPRHDHRAQTRLKKVSAQR